MIMIIFNDVVALKAVFIIVIIVVPIFILWREDIKIKSAVQRCHQGTTVDKFDTRDKCDVFSLLFLFLLSLLLLLLFLFLLSLLLLLLLFSPLLSTGRHNR